VCWWVERAAWGTDGDRLAGWHPHNPVQAPPAESSSHKASAIQEAFVGTERQLVNAVGLEHVRDVISDALLLDRHALAQVKQSLEVSLPALEICEGFAEGVVGLEVEAIAQPFAQLGLQPVVGRERTVADVIRDECVRVRG